MTRQSPFAGGGPVLADSGAQSVPDSYELLEGDLGCGLLLLADHASNFIPPEYGDLGLPEAALKRHIAYDIGVGPLTRDLAERFHAPAVLTKFSRLLIDPNRGEDDPTLIMRLSDGDVVPGNARSTRRSGSGGSTASIGPTTRRWSRRIDAMLATGQVPAILSIHSYTPVWKGTERPWHAGILWDSDPRFSRPLLDALRAEHGLRVGDNEPYSGALKNDTMYRHGSSRGLAHALLEVRNDLIETPAGVLEWADRLEPLLREILEDQTLHEIRHYGSAADADGRRSDEGDDDAANGRSYAHGA